MTTEATERKAHWTVPFFTVWIGQAFSTVGSALAQFALVWWLTIATGSATVLTTATLAALAPGVLLGPLAGAVVDRWNRKWVLMGGDAVVALAALWMVYLFWHGAMSFWYIYVILIARGAAGAFHWAALQSTMPLMVPKQHLARVAGMNQTLDGAVKIIAPPMGALVLALLPLWAVMLIDVVTAGLAIVIVASVHIPQPQRQVLTPLPKGQTRTLLHDIGEGLRYMWQWPGMFVLLIGAMLINFLLTPTAYLVPILVAKQFGGDAIHLGGMNSANGIGVVVGGLILSVWGGFHRRILTSLMGLGTLLMGLTPATAWYVALAGSFITGAMNPIINGPMLAVIQGAVEPRMQGRVITVVGSLAMSMAPLSMIIAGPVSDLFGVRVWYILAGTLITIAGIGGFFIRSVVHIEERYGVSNVPSPPG
jgi:DHA3 family macrolide efflux protein-like MFS transporter